jgi:hypothetical protein
MWHGDAIGRVLAAHGDDADIPRIAALRQGRPDPFADPAGRAMAARIDRRIDRLPGLADLSLVAGAVDRYTSAPVPGGPIASAA